MQDQDAGLMPDINDLPDNFYVQDELLIRADVMDHLMNEEIPLQPRVLAEP